MGVHRADVIRPPVRLLLIEEDGFRPGGIGAGDRGRKADVLRVVPPVRPRPVRGPEVVGALPRKKARDAAQAFLPQGRRPQEEHARKGGGDDRRAPRAAQGQGENGHDHPHQDKVGTNERGRSPQYPGNAPRTRPLGGVDRGGQRIQATEEKGEGERAVEGLGRKVDKHRVEREQEAGDHRGQSAEPAPRKRGHESGSRRMEDDAQHQGCRE